MAKHVLECPININANRDHCAGLDVRQDLRTKMLQSVTQESGESAASVWNSTHEVNDDVSGAGPGTH